jgi:hypothetical protein
VPATPLSRKLEMVAPGGVAEQLEIDETLGGA